MIENPEYRHLMEYALRVLARRAHTSSEMREKLLKRSERKQAWRRRNTTTTDSQKPHHPNGVEDLVLSRLIELKLIDDVAFVKRQIENAQNFKHEGYLKTAFRLKKKGISVSETKKYWQATMPDETKIAAAALAKFDKKNKISAELNMQQSRTENFDRASISHKLFQRRARFLASRGFSPDVIYKLIKF